MCIRDSTITYQSRYIESVHYWESRNWFSSNGRIVPSRYDNTIRLYKDDAIVAQASQSWNMNQWYNFTIKVYAQYIEVYVDGTLKINYSDSGSISRTPYIKFWVHATDTEWDNITITGIPQPYYSGNKVVWLFTPYGILARRIFYGDGTTANVKMGRWNVDSSIPEYLISQMVNDATRDIYKILNNPSYNTEGYLMGLLCGVGSNIVGYENQSGGYIIYLPTLSSLPTFEPQIIIDRWQYYFGNTITTVRGQKYVFTVFIGGFTGIEKLNEELEKIVNPQNLHYSFNTLDLIAFAEKSPNGIDANLLLQSYPLNVTHESYFSINQTTLFTSYEGYKLYNGSVSYTHLTLPTTERV